MRILKGMYRALVMLVGLLGWGVCLHFTVRQWSFTGALSVFLTVLRYFF